MGGNRSSAAHQTRTKPYTPHVDMHTGEEDVADNVETVPNNVQTLLGEAGAWLGMEHASPTSAHDMVVDVDMVVDHPLAPQLNIVSALAGVYRTRARTHTQTHTSIWMCVRESVCVRERERA
jgi:hypothetical protein